MKYRKKPVIIEAKQYDGANYISEIWPWFRCSSGAHDGSFFEGADGVVIGMREGKMTASLGDWIIKGVNGEFYPCKPDIFEATYEPIVEQPK
jgi:hypothetical protein